jgi:molybdopterin/thiamine biosynthesis adenylyltransferase
MRDTWRQQDFYTPKPTDEPVVIIGCGHIGSWVAMGLAKMGAPFIVVDPDVVEPHNLPNQFFREDISATMPKVLALESTLKILVPEHKGSYLQNKIEDVSQLLENRIVVVAVDSMSVRHWIWSKWKPKENDYLIDSRSGGEHASVFIIDGANMDSKIHYSTTLFTDEEASQLPCTGKAVSDVSMMISSIILNSVRKLISGKPIISMHTCIDMSIGHATIYSAMSGKTVIDIAPYYGDKRNGN